MRRIIPILFSVLIFGQCNPQPKPTKTSHTTSTPQTHEIPPPKYDTLEISVHGFKGTFQGPEFNEAGDIAHQFSNKAAKLIGDFLKECYLKKTYLRIHFPQLKVVTKGLDQQDSVYYSLEIPFKQATACSAHTGIEHCGSWNYQPKLWLNQRLKQQKKALSKISIGRMECAFFESSEGFQEYWIAFHHKNYQAGCQ